MSSSFYRVSTANMYDASLRNVSARQKSLVDLQENLTSGKRVVRPSDDPVAAAQAERALTRISRIQAEQRALEVQRNAIAQAESTLGDAVGLVQEIRQLVVAAGGGTLKPEDRKTYASQIQSLREQLTDVINRKDTNGIPLLGALGSALEPFTGPLLANPDYLFAGLPGQTASGTTYIPTTVDGHAALMFDPQRDGVFEATISTTNPTNPLDGRRFGTDTVQVKDAHLLPNPASTYSLTFKMASSSDGGKTYDIAYDITDSSGATVGTGTHAGLKPDQLQTIPIKFTDGAEISFNVNATPTLDPTKGTAWDWSSSEGIAAQDQYADAFSLPKPLDPIYRVNIPPPNFVLSPAPGDTVKLTASSSLMGAINSAISDIGNAPNNNAAAQAVGQALANIDKGLERLHMVRGYAGELLNRADRITGDQENRSIQLEGDRSRAEDLDMIKGISDFENANVGYQAALKSYAQVQRLSLFDYLR